MRKSHPASPTAKAYRRSACSRCFRTKRRPRNGSRHGDGTVTYPRCDLAEVSISKKHLNRYVSEFVVRHKKRIREMDTADHMEVLVADMIDRRIMYDDLVSSEDGRSELHERLNWRT